MTTVYTGGTFDLFHTGHVNLLRRCRDLALPDGKVVVALNTDEFVEQFKGKRPVIPYEDREAVLWACRYVDCIVPNWGGADSRPSIEAIAPDIIAVGSDWLEKDYHGQLGLTQQWLDSRGIRIVYLPRTTGISSSDIRRWVA